MEDYYAAFLRCVDDVKALDENGRRIAAMHFAGVSVECLLKYIILASLPEGATKDWYDGTEKTENYGHTFTNPKHDYQEALNRFNKLKSLVRKDNRVNGWLFDIETPSNHFIDLRYSSKEPDDKTYKEWKWKYQELVSWLGTRGLALVETKEGKKYETKLAGDTQKRT